MDVFQVDKLSKSISPPTTAADLSPPRSELTCTPSTYGFDSVTLSTMKSPSGTNSYETEQSSRSTSDSMRSILSSNKSGRLSALEREQREMKESLAEFPDMKRALADVQSKLDIALQNHGEVDMLRRQDREQKRRIEELERQLMQRQTTNTVDHQELYEEVQELRQSDRNQRRKIQELERQLHVQQTSTESMVSEEELGSVNSGLHSEGVHLSNNSLEKASKKQPFSAKQKLKGVIHAVLIITKLRPVNRKVEKNNNGK